MAYGKIGSVSHGTLRTEDLMGTFASELTNLVKLEAPHLGALNPDYMDIVSKAYSITDFDSDEASEVLHELIDALNEFAPPYCYFGSTEGDGSDFGFWPIGDFQQQIVDDGGLVVSDLSEVNAAEAGEGYVLVVNDHGNCTLYWCNGKELTEIWSIV